MRHLQYTIICLASILGSISCNTNSSYHQTSSDSLNVFSIGEITPDLLIEDIFDSVQLIQLETTPESLLGDIRKLQIMNDKFYMLDFNGTMILSFDKNGKFITKMQMQGRGPNEYIMLQWMSADPISKKILACDGALRKIFIYDENLNLEKVIKTDFMPGCVTALRNNLILQHQSDNKVHEDDETVKNFDVHLINMEGDAIKGLIKNRTPERGVIGPNQTVFQENGDIQYFPALGDTVYNISMSTGSVQPIYIIKSDPEYTKSFSEEQRKEFKFKSDSRPDFVEWEEKGYILPIEFYDSGSYIIIHSGHNLKYIYSKKTGNSRLYDPNTIEGESSLKALTKYTLLIDNDWFYHTKNAITMQHMSDYHQFSGKYKTMIDSLETDANPVIVRFKLKDF